MLVPVQPPPQPAEPEAMRVAPPSRESTEYRAVDAAAASAPAQAAGGLAVGADFWSVDPPDEQPAPGGEHGYREGMYEALVS